MRKWQLYVCYSINDFFVREAGISMIGLFENNPAYRPEEVFFLDYGLHPANKVRLSSIAAGYGRRVTYIDAKTITAPLLREFPNLNAWQGSMAPNAKCFVEHIFPDYVERLLFVDGDAVVAGSVAELESLDMEGAAIGAVPIHFVSSDIGKRQFELYSGNRFYFNSGVLLYDMTVWRRENCHQMIVDTLHRKKRLKWPDQTLLNNAIPERLIKLLPLKYNYTSHYVHPRLERRLLQQGHLYTDQEIDEAISRPAIIHYIGGWPYGRPWYEGCRSHCQEAYFRYKALSPWKDSPLFPPRKENFSGFMVKWYRWKLRLLMRCPSFTIYCAVDWLYNVVCDMLYKPDAINAVPSEGKESIDNL